MKYCVKGGIRAIQILVNTVTLASKPIADNSEKYKGIIISLHNLSVSEKFNDFIFFTFIYVQYKEALLIFSSDHSPFYPTHHSFPT